MNPLRAQRHAVALSRIHAHAGDAKRRLLDAIDIAEQADIANRYQRTLTRLAADLEHFQARISRATGDAE